MAELFRYIQQGFVVRSDRQPIDVGRRSDLQNQLRDALSERLSRDRLRGIADAFIARHFSSPLDDPLRLGPQLRIASERLAQPLDGPSAVEQVIVETFGSNAATLVVSDAFVADKALLDDLLVAVKISTGFDRVNAQELVAMRRVIAFIEDVASGKVTGSIDEAVRAAFGRPIRIPGEFVSPVATSAAHPTPPPPEPPDEAPVRKFAALLADQQHLKRAYETIMSLPPDQLELKPVKSRQDGRLAETTSAGTAAHGGSCAGEMNAVPSPPSFLAVSDAVVEQLGVDVKRTLEKAGIDITRAPVSDVIARIKREWQQVSHELAPYQAAAPARVFRLGAHLFSVQDGSAALPTRGREVQ